MIRNTPEHKQEETDCQRIKLEPEQALQVPFPPGCPVLVMDKVLQNRILCSGEVTSVFVSFARNTGSCDNSYKVASMNVSGQMTRKIVNGAQVRYAINCPVKVLQSGASNLKSIDGTIVGFESQPSSMTKVPSPDISAFLYTVDVTVFDNNKKGQLLRQRGISPSYLRFRSLAQTQYLEKDKSSVVSFDEVSGREDLIKNSISGSSDEQGEIAIPAEKKIKVEDSPSISIRNPTTPTSDITGCPNYSMQAPATCRLIVTSFTNCTPISSPIPGKFQGDMEKYKNAAVPDFISLVNFPTSSRQGIHADGTKMCVMCGQSRFLSSPKMVSKMKARLANMNRSDSCSSPTHSAIIPAQNKGLCTYCDVNIWIVKESKLQIKWCKGCKNFQNWASFGEKGGATKCLRCRDRQREKYAASKQERSTAIKRKST